MGLLIPEAREVWREADLRVYIDFDRDDDFGDLIEDITEYVMTCEWHLGARQPYQLMADETELTLMLKNVDRRWFPENTASPYYGMLGPYLKVKVTCTFEGTTYPMYLGFIDKILPRPGVAVDATIKCVGSKQQLQDQEISLPLLTNVRTDEVIQLVMDRLVLPPAINSDAWFLGIAGSSEIGTSTYLGDSTLAYDLQVGGNTIPFVADNWSVNFHGNQYVGEDWDSGFKGWDALEDVVKAERGRLFFDREGKAVFWNRSYLQSIQTLDGAWAAEDVTAQGYGLASLDGYGYGDHIANKVYVSAYPRQADSVNSTLYTLDEPITIAAGDERVITAKFTPDDSEDHIAAIDPEIDTLTYSGLLTFGIEYLGDKAKITITNVAQTDVEETAGSVVETGYESFKSSTVSSAVEGLEGELTALTIIGKKLTTFEEVEALREDGTSRALYGGREYKIDSKLINDSNDANSIAEYELSRRKDPFGAYRSVEIRPQTRAAMRVMLGATMGDAYSLDDGEGHSDVNYVIVGEDQAWHRKTGWTSKKYIERIDQTAGWLLGVTGYSELGETTRLGY